MSILIRNATILAMDDGHASTPFTGDILIEEDRIAAIGKVAPDRRVDRVIDGGHLLAMPGLVNGHLHSGEALFKGRYDNLPLELWMLYSYPILGASPLAERLIYLRTMLVAIESLRNGVTCVTDDVFEAPRQNLGQLGAVFDAYADIGMRATVSGHVIDRNFLDTIPFTGRFVPKGLRDKVAAETPPSPDEYIAFCKQAIQRFHNREGRLRFMVAPSAPQRCTPELMLAADELARHHGMPFHTHIVETKVQAVTGPALYGKTLVRYMHELGLLHPGITIAHSIWVTDDDIALMGDAGVSIVHNVISNQKLGAGIAPIRKLLKAGINVALGSDGICSNDTPRMFDVMHAANVSTPDYRRWLTAHEVLHAATRGGARSALIEHDIGSLAPGKKADIVLLDTRTAPFTPLNDIRNHLVYCENGSSIDKVIVNGEIVLENDRLTRISEAALLDELRALMPEFQRMHKGVEEANRVFEPFFAAIHRHCNEQDIGIHRLGTDDAWVDEKVTV
jgi:5-methylthioadenosine/S-adenosylhomocysteine deaminase